jgi:hypothetical protein
LTTLLFVISLLPTVEIQSQQIFSSVPVQMQNHTTACSHERFYPRQTKSGNEIALIFQSSSDHCDKFAIIPIRCPKLAQLRKNYPEFDQRKSARFVGYLPMKPSHRIPKPTNDSPGRGSEATP